MLNNINKEIISFKETEIMEVANFGRNHAIVTGEKVYPAWFGEGDTPTDKIIYDKAVDALVKGKTFYTFQNGIPNLRLEISKYMNEIFKILDFLPNSISKIIFTVLLSFIMILLDTFEK